MTQAATATTIQRRQEAAADVKAVPAMAQHSRHGVTGLHVGGALRDPGRNSDHHPAPPRKSPPARKQYRRWQILPATE